MTKKGSVSRDGDGRFDNHDCTYRFGLLFTDPDPFACEEAKSECLAQLHFKTRCVVTDAELACQLTVSEVEACMEIQSLERAKIEEIMSSDIAGNEEAMEAARTEICDMGYHCDGWMHGLDTEKLGTWVALEICGPVYDQCPGLFDGEPVRCGDGVCHQDSGEDTTTCFVDCDDTVECNSDEECSPPTDRCFRQNERGRRICVQRCGSDSECPDDLTCTTGACL